MADKQLTTPKVKSNELQKWHESNPIEELFYSQKEVARFLELGYLALRDHPKVAAEIRNTAHKSRTQHVLTTGLFKRFVVSASSVVNDYCPMMMTAVELKNKDIVLEALEQVLEICLEMKKASEEARNSYLIIQAKVQSDLGTVNITNEEISTKKDVIEQTKKSEQIQLEETQKQEKELEREKAKLTEKAQKLEDKRDDCLDNAASFGDIESLKEAETQLCYVDKQFEKIIDFWDSMALMLQQLHREQKAGGIYLKKIEDARYANNFKDSINKAENNWNRIGLVCQHYVDVNDEVIMSIYGFLSSPIGNMTEGEVEKRKAAVKKEIRYEAEHLDDVDATVRIFDAKPIKELKLLSVQTIKKQFISFDTSEVQSILPGVKFNAVSCGESGDALIDIDTRIPEKPEKMAHEQLSTNKIDKRIPEKTEKMAHEQLSTNKTIKKQFISFDTFEVQSILPGVKFNAVSCGESGDALIDIDTRIPEKPEKMAHEQLSTNKTIKKQFISFDTFEVQSILPGVKFNAVSCGESGDALIDIDTRIPEKPEKMAHEQLSTNKIDTRIPEKPEKIAHVQLSTNKELRDIPRKLEILVSELSDDNETEIKNNILGLIAEASTSSRLFTGVMQNEGSVVLHNKRALMETCNPSQVDVQNLKDALTSLQKKLKEMRITMFVLEGHVHKLVEECRTRSKQHGHDIKLKNIDIDRLTKEISDLEVRIQKCMFEAKYEDKDADSCEKRARKLEDKADKHKDAGVLGSLALFGAGIIGAPFTGGASLVLAGGAAAGNLGYNLNCASGCAAKAESHRQSANQKRQEAARHRQTKWNSERDIANKETEVNTIKQRNEKIAKSCTQLKDIEQQLYIAIQIIDDVIEHVQNLDTTLLEAETQGNSFKIIQSAFGRNPQKLEGRAHYYLTKLKEKWDYVENYLKQAQELPTTRN